MKTKKRRLLAVAALIAATLLCFAACDKSETPNDTQGEATTAEQTGTAPDESVSETDTETETETEEVTTVKDPLTWETYDPALDNSTVDTSATHTVNNTQWVCVDGLGRIVPINSDTGDKREDKTVAMFYWTWHGEFADAQTAYNNQKNIDTLIAKGYTEQDYFSMTPAALRKLGVYTIKGKPGTGSYHFWDEPIYGYYDGDDEWVIRKQAELLASAGVDVVFFDNTNGTFTWMETAMKVMKVFSEARAQGVNAPDVSFMLNFGAIEATAIQLEKLYDNIYAKGLYQDVWYEMDGKPMIMAHASALNRQNNEKHKTIYEFFTFRANIGGYTDSSPKPGQWGWLSRYPQAYYSTSDGTPEQITVGVALNHDYVKTLLAPMSYPNIIGRTWTSRGYDTRENALFYGACFEQQWENALKVDPNVVFVTGWNEWVAMRIGSWDIGAAVYEDCFVDQYNAEYSRDCEPSNGIMKDHYYYQLVSMIRKYKGTDAIEQASPEKLIDVNGGFGQWANVGPTYNDYFGLSDRDALGYKDPSTGKRFHYTNNTGRNDIYDCKVARDYETVYFMVRTVEDLTPYTDAYWMRLYLSLGNGEQGWEGYQYILNKTNPENETTATLERFTGNGFDTEVVGKVTYSVKGNVLTVAIPKTMLGIANDCYDFTIDFKWTDNTQEDGDIMKWYVNGDVAPVGRYNYRYTTTGSAAYVPAEDADVLSRIDFTDATVQQNFESMLADVKGFKTEFGADGLTLTSTAVGNNTELTLNMKSAFVDAIPAERCKTIRITYKVTDGSTDTLRAATAYGTMLEPSKARADEVELTTDGAYHVAVFEIGGARDPEGYVTKLGIYLRKTAEAGSTITISSIEFSTDEIAE